MNKQETIQFRVDTELKESFLKKATQMGKSSSELFRSLMLRTIDDHWDVESKFDEIRQTLIQLIHILFKSSYEMEDPSMFIQLRDSVILNYLSDLSESDASHTCDFNSAVGDHRKNLHKQVYDENRYKGIYISDEIYNCLPAYFDNTIVLDQIRDDIQAKKDVKGKDTD